MSDSLWPIDYGLRPKFSGIRVEVNNGTVGPSVIDVDEKTQVRIIRQQSVRVATEGDDVFIYHNFDNPR